jgi:hypothetical protein
MSVLTGNKKDGVVVATKSAQSMKSHEPMQPTAADCEDEHVIDITTRHFHRPITTAAPTAAEREFMRRTLRDIPNIETEDFNNRTKWSA